MIWVVVPVDYTRRCLDGQGLNNVHVVTDYLFTATMVRLAASWQVFRSICPEHSEVDVGGISCTNLEDFCEPMLYRVWCILFFFDLLHEYNLADLKLLAVDGEFAIAAGALPIE